MTAWILSDHKKTGTLNQCLGVAHALGLSAEIKIIKPAWPWRWLPPSLWFNPLSAFDSQLAPIAPPWPDIIIGGGRASVAPCLALKAKYGAACIFVMDPRCHYSEFDIIIAPTHDDLKGDNILTTLGGVHRLTEESLTQAAIKLRIRLGDIHGPYIGVLLGGNSTHYTYTANNMKQLALSLTQTFPTGSFVITPSRRTPLDLLDCLKEHLKGRTIFCWDGTQDNPYQGILGLADNLVVTEDSVSMAYEACFTGKPVYIQPLGIKKSKFNYFFESLYQGNYARPLLLQKKIQPDQTSIWKPKRLDELSRIQAELQKRILAIKTFNPS